MLRAAEIIQQSSGHYFVRPEAYGAHADRRLGVIVYQLVSMRPLMQCVSAKSDLSDIEGALRQCAVDDFHASGVCGIRLRRDSIFVSDQGTIEVLNFGGPAATRVQPPYVSSSLDLDRGLKPQADHHRWAELSYELLTGINAGESMTPIHLLRTRASRSLGAAIELILHGDIGATTTPSRIIGDL